MALIKTDDSIIEIYGGFGGVYFKRGKDGRHIQAMPRHVNYARTPAQQGSFGESSPFGMGGIKGYSGAAGLWLAALLLFYSGLWAAFALGNLFQTKKDGKKHITGYNWYIYYAMTFPETERPPYWKPPHSPSELPAFLIAFKGLWTYQHRPDEWPLESPSDYYWLAGEFNGKPFYDNDKQEWYLWWDGANWIVSEGVDFKGPGLTFVSPGADIAGYYKNPDTSNYSHVYFGNPDEKDLPH